MDKVKLEFKIPKNKKIEYNGVEFEVTPFLSMANQAVLINRYIAEYFGKVEIPVTKGSDYNYLGAEFSLKNNILQAVTNIDTEPLENDFYVDPDLWNSITREIINYWEFDDSLHYIVSEIKEQYVLKSSVGKVISDLADKVYPLLESLSNITPEEIEKLTESTKGLMKEVEETSFPGKVERAPRKKKLQ